MTCCPHCGGRIAVVAAEAVPKPESDPLVKRIAQDDADFAEFWQAYPRKVGKRDALKAWKLTRKQRPPVAEIIAAVEVLSRTPAWREKDGQFIPHPGTWLRRGGWEDDPAAMKRSGNGQQAIDPYYRKLG